MTPQEIRIAALEDAATLAQTTADRFGGTAQFAAFMVAVCIREVIAKERKEQALCPSTT